MLLCDVQVSLLTWKADACVHCSRGEDALKLSLAAVQLARSTRTLLTAFHVALLCRPASEAVDIFLRLQRGEVVSGEGAGEGVEWSSPIRGGGRGGRGRLRDEHGDESLSSAGDDLDRLISACKVARESPLADYWSSHERGDHDQNEDACAGEGGGGACDVAVDLLLREWLREYISSALWRPLLSLPPASSTDTGIDTADGEDAMDCGLLSEDFREQASDSVSGSGSPALMEVLCELCQLFFRLHVRLVPPPEQQSASMSVSAPPDPPPETAAVREGEHSQTRSESPQHAEVGGEGGGSAEGEGGKAEDIDKGADENMENGADTDNIADSITDKCMDMDDVSVLMSADASHSYDLLVGRGDGCVGVGGTAGRLLCVLEAFVQLFGDIEGGVGPDKDLSALGAPEDAYWMGDVAWNMVRACRCYVFLLVERVLCAYMCRCKYQLVRNCGLQRMHRVCCS